MNTANPKNIFTILAKENIYFKFIKPSTTQIGMFSKTPWVEFFDAPIEEQFKGKVCYILSLSYKIFKM